MVRAKYSKSFTFLIILTAGLILISGCGKNNPTAPAGTPATVEGRVNGNGGYQRMAKSSAVSGIGGAMVLLAEIQVDGSLQTVSSGSITTDADGKFALETNLDGVKNLVVVASKDSEKWEAVVTSEVKSGSVVYSQPLNDETTSETEIYLTAKANGDNIIGYDEIAAYIDSAIAAQIKTDHSLIGSVEASIQTSVDAQQKAYIVGGINISSTDEAKIEAAKADAKASLDRNLYFSSDQTSIDAAFNAYNKDILNAYLNAGVSAVTLVKVLEISQCAFVNYVDHSAINLKAKFELNQNSAERKSELLNLAVQSEFSENAGSQDQLNGLINAGSRLISAVEEASDTAEINAAFNAYRSDLSDVLTVTLGLDPGTFSALQSIVTDLKSSLYTSIGTTSSADAIVAAYISFYSGVSNAVTGSVNSPDSSKAKLIADAFIMLNTEF